MNRRAAPALALFVAIACVMSARMVRADDAELYARVIVDSTTLRSGPSPSFRRVYVAHRGEVFPIVERATRNYWFRVQLPDGTYGWVLGDAVYNHEVGSHEANGGRFLPWLFAPPPLPQATGELSITAGLLGRGGFFAVRPSLLISPSFGIELTAAGNVAAGGELLMGGLGGIVNIFPSSPLVPFVTIGGGIAVSNPNSDTFLLKAGTTAMTYGGGGLRIGFRYRFTIRIEARAYAFYDANRYVTKEEISGGITVFF